MAEAISTTAVSILTTAVTTLTTAVTTLTTAVTTTVVLPDTRKVREKALFTVSVAMVVEHQVRVARDRVLVTAAAGAPNFDKETPHEIWTVVNRC